MTTHFYLGANSGEGFASLYDQLGALDDTYDRMILKGGPGVGKSTFMKSIGKAMEEAGTDVEYLWCSGDPDSLDGLVLPQLHCSIVDGTAPHVIEAEYPAAVDRYVDLGRFYDLTAAKRNRKEIVAYTTENHAAYARVYHNLKAARQVELDALTAVQKTMDWDRAERRLDGIIARELRRRGTEEGRTVKRFLGSITFKGPQWRFDSVKTLCPRVYELADSWELSGILLKRLHSEAVRKGWNTIVCPAPEDPKRPEHLLIPGLGLAFVTSRPGMTYPDKPARRIRLDAMVRPEGRARLRFETRMAALLREEAVSALQEAKTAHDRLEGVYNPYVDFDAVRAQAAVETARLLSWL